MCVCVCVRRSANVMQTSIYFTSNVILEALLEQSVQTVACLRQKSQVAIHLVYILCTYVQVCLCHPQRAVN